MADVSEVPETTSCRSISRGSPLESLKRSEILEPNPWEGPSALETKIYSIYQHLGSTLRASPPASTQENKSEAHGRANLDPI